MGAWERRNGEIGKRRMEEMEKLSFSCGVSLLRIGNPPPWLQAKNVVKG
jgi:hypothetical protein